MNFSRVLFFVFACLSAFAMASAAPWNPFKELERAGQRVRDAVISAAAVATVGQAAAIARGG
uniref:Bactericidin B-5P n=1 Tax=Manduca sexta TaxID=7130 RepID=CEC5_MANSE|nr:RecName: Full=Bactericidin B-5P; AltName: Full=Cecropin-like peptide B-5; Flags: Precursor [Manduca sexta]AAA29306.1 bactericidin [Manduca sexta]